METKKLSELCLSITDCPHSTPKWTTTGKLVIRNQNIKNGKLDLSNPSYTDEQNYNLRCKRAKPIAGDLIITREAPMGEVCIVPENLECCLGQRMVLLKVNEDLCSNLFLLYSLMSRPVQHQIRWSEGTGTTVSNLRIPHLENLDIPYIPLSQQYVIADALSSLDNKVELNNRINKNLEAQAQAIFNEWFFRKDTQNNWGVLGDIADINPSRKLSKGTVARYIEMSNLASTTAFPLGWEEKPYSGGVKFQNGDTLLARITPCLENGKGAYINFLQEGEIAFGSTEYIVITGKKGYCNEFFYFLIRYLDFQLYAAKSMTGSSGRQRVSADSIASYKMPIPSLELCEKFHEIAEQVMTSNCNRSLENRTLSKLRDTLLPKLMSGEIQIPQEV